jgi:hypothetical protein
MLVGFLDQRGFERGITGHLPLAETGKVRAADGF